MREPEEVTGADRFRWRWVWLGSALVGGLVGGLAAREDKPFFLIPGLLLWVPPAIGLWRDSRHGPSTLPAAGFLRRMAYVSAFMFLGTLGVGLPLELWADPGWLSGLVLFGAGVVFFGFRLQSDRRR